MASKFEVPTKETIKTVMTERHLPEIFSCACLLSVYLSKEFVDVTRCPYVLENCPFLLR